MKKTYENVVIRIVQTKVNDVITSSPVKESRGFKSEEDLFDN